MCVTNRQMLRRRWTFVMCGVEKIFCRGKGPAPPLYGMALGPTETMKRWNIVSHCVREVQNIENVSQFVCVCVNASRADRTRSYGERKGKFQWKVFIRRRIIEIYRSSSSVRESTSWWCQRKITHTHTHFHSDEVSEKKRKIWKIRPHSVHRRRIHIENTLHFFSDRFDISSSVPCNTIHCAYVFGYIAPRHIRSVITHRNTQKKKTVLPPARSRMRVNVNVVCRRRISRQHLPACVRVFFVCVLIFQWTTVCVCVCGVWRFGSAIRQIRRRFSNVGTYSIWNCVYLLKRTYNYLWLWYIYTRRHLRMRETRIDFNNSLSCSLCPSSTRHSSSFSCWNSIKYYKLFQIGRASRLVSSCSEFFKWSPRRWESACVVWKYVGINFAFESATRHISIAFDRAIQPLSAFFVVITVIFHPSGWTFCAKCSLFSVGTCDRRRKSSIAAQVVEKLLRRDACGKLMKWRRRKSRSELVRFDEINSSAAVRCECVGCVALV